MATTGLQVIDSEVAQGKELSPEPKTKVGNGQKCVLLIEDSEDAMCLVRYALTEFGGGKYTLEWANCLSNGLSRILQGGIDIVLLDLGLPESSGSLSYAWVREAAPEVPVVVLTGDTRQETELCVFSSGADDYLVKQQISGPRLVSSINDAIYKARNRQNHQDAKSEYTHRFKWRPRI